MHVYVLNDGSGWPTPALRILSQFTARALGMTGSYTVAFKTFRNPKGWAGRAWRHQGNCVVRLNRRFVPWTGKYPLEYHSKLSPLIVCNNRIEVLVHIIAHEFAHLSRPQRHEKRGYEEYFCEDMGNQVLEKMRQKWPELRAKIWAKMRLEHARSRQKALRVAESRSPGKRALNGLEMAQNNLLRWRRKLKLAQTKVKLYTRKVSYYTKKAEAVNSAIGY